jgi:hypothetical protein
VTARQIGYPKAAAHEQQLGVYSVEKLISQAHVILQAHAKVAENPQ